MARGDKEIKELIQEIERGFDDLRAEAQKDQHQLYRHPEYAKSLIAELDDQITTRIPVPSSIPDNDAFQTEGILRQSFSFHVEPKPGKGDRSPSVQRADRQELFYAHAWGIKFDKDSAISDPTHRYQAVGPFAPWWLDWTGFALPKEEDKRDEYRKSYWPFQLSVPDPLTVGFVPDDRGQPTLAARHFDLPYFEIAKRYGKATDENALDILNTKFPYLRGGRGQSIEYGEMHTKKATVWVVDDLNTICRYITLANDTKQYEQLDDEHPNPWGGSSLTIVTGRYNADAVLLKDRYMGLLKPLLHSQRTLDVLDSHIASVALTPSKWAEQLPEEIARAVQAEGRNVPIEFGDQGIATFMGNVTEMKTRLDAEVKELRATRTADRDMTRPPPYLTNPDEALVKSATAAAQLNAFETSNRAFDGARKSKIAGVMSVMKKIEHFICEGHLNKKGQPKEANEAIHIRLSGKEPTKKYSGNRKDEELEIGPEDFEEGDTLEITLVASSQSQKALEYELASAQQLAGYKTREQVLETITEDVSGQIEKLEEEARYQQYGPLIDNADLMAFIEVLRMESAGPDGSGGMDLSQLLISLLGGGQPAAPQQPVQESTIGVQTTAPPPTGTPDVGVMQ